MQEVPEDLLQIQAFWATNLRVFRRYQAGQVDREVGLQWRVLEQVRQHFVLVGFFLELELDAHVVGRDIADVQQHRHLARDHDVCDALDQYRFIHRVRDAGNVQRLRGLAGLGQLPGSADLDRTLTGLVDLLQFFRACDDVPAGRKVRALDRAAQLTRGELTSFDQSVEQSHRGRHHFFRVVRRNIGGHAHGDAGGPVDQHVRDRRRQDDRFLLGAVVVGPEVHRILVDFPEDLIGERCQPAFRVAIGGGRIAVERAEIARAVDQWGAQIEGLRHTHQGVVNRGITVRVVVTHHVTYDFCALPVLGVASHALLPHRVQDAALHGLQAVAHVRNGSAGDDRKRVVQVAGLRDLVERCRFFVEHRRLVIAATTPLLGRIPVAGGVLLVLALACRQRFDLPRHPLKKSGRAGTARFASFLSCRKSISSEEMRVRTTKAHWFALPLSGLAQLAQLALGCQRAPRPLLDQAACEREGIVSSRVSERADAGDLAAEIVQTCADCRTKARPGAPPGSACSAASVCRESCCRCPNSLVKNYRARVCDAAHCAGPEACVSARAGIKPDVCD